MNTRTVSEARTIASAILTEAGFSRGTGRDAATWFHADGRVGRLQYWPASGDPERIASVKFQAPSVDGVLPMPTDLIDF